MVLQFFTGGGQYSAVRCSHCRRRRKRGRRGGGSRKSQIDARGGQVKCKIKTVMVGISGSVS